MSALDSMDRAVTMECNCCGNRDASRFVKREDGYVCKCCGQWFRYETDEEKSRCSQGYENLSNYKFDDARSIFQRVIIDNPGSVSARWGLLLARFGIVFTKAFAKTDAEPIYCFPEYDEITGKRFSGEEEYAEMIELIGTDEELIYFYKTKVKEIDSAIEKIQQNKISSVNDVFICVKSDAATEKHPELTGETEDFAFAKKIYGDLTSHGVNVFLAPVTLGTNERADELIWPNLVKSKKMLLITSKEEYTDSTWVKSEWRRWNGLGREKELYICVLRHENESPKSVLPHELLRNESQIYTLDTYDKLINEISVDDSCALEGQENGKLLLKGGREERIRFGLVEIGANAFKGRTDIISVSLPATVAVIGNGAFAGCSSLESLTVRKGTAIIEDNAFYGCEKLHDISLPGTVSRIGNRAFGGCNGLISFNIPEATESIGEGAFFGCGGLMSINVPAGVKSFGMGALGRCKNLSAITVDENNECYSSIGNCLLDIKSRTLVAGCKGSVIPFDGSIRAIGESAFAGCDIRNAAIPEGVSVIGNSAFAGCAELTNISIPSSVTEIGGYAFALCKNLLKITVDSGNERFSAIGNCLINKQNKILVVGTANSRIPDDGTVEIIGAQAFMGLDINSIILPESIEMIENEAFRDCRHLTALNIPAKVISIGEDSFRGCEKLTAVNCEPTVWQRIRIGKGNEPLVCAKEGKASTASYGGYTPMRRNYLENSETENRPYGSYASHSSASTYSPRGISSMDYGASAYEKENTQPSFGEVSFGMGKHDYSEGKEPGKIVFVGGIEENIMYGIKEIKEGAYRGRNDIISIELPESVKRIGTNAFAGCTKLESIVLSESVTDIGTRAFSGCRALAEIALPEGLESLGEAAFYGCASLKKFAIPAKISLLGADMFANCAKLESINITASLAEIGERAFAECSCLKNIYFSGTQAQWKAVSVGAGNPKLGGFLAKIKVNFNS